jgi:general secretion pathway protein D
VQYLDVGLKLEVEPDIHLDNEVVIKVGLDVSNIIKQVQNADSGTVAYEVGTRNANTVLRLKDGETQILAGLISDEDRTTASKVPGLGQIPIVGRLFSSNKGDSSKSEIVLSITPHIVGSASLPDINNQEYWTGTESSTRDGLLNIKSVGSIVASSSAVAATSASAPLVRSRPMAPPPRTGAPVSQQPSTPATPVTLSWQGPAQVKQGERLSLTLNAQSQQAVSSLGLQVNFDPSVFKAIEVVPGSYLKQGNFQPALNKTINQESGQVQFNLAGAGAVGASGTGSLATLVFEAIAANPQSQIAVEQIAPVGPGGEALPATQPNPLIIEVVP